MISLKIRVVVLPRLATINVSRLKKFTASLSLLPSSKDWSLYRLRHLPVRCLLLTPSYKFAYVLI